MITIRKKRLFFTLTENWFGYKFKWSDLFLPVCYRALRNDVNYQLYFGVKKYTKTVVLPIDKPIEEIHANFNKTLKAHIRKGEAANVQCYTNNDIAGFAAFYNPFAILKGLLPLDVNTIHEYAIAEWKSSYAVMNGEILVAHSYLEDKESGIVRLMESGSMRLHDEFDSKTVAHANKVLHYYDIKYFKERGLQIYDFGGWDDLPGLLEFKESFGAYPINIYNYFSYAYNIKENLKGIAKYIKKK
ncbi:MAG: hypothetical protein ABI760_18535 [Ferruginibacter sp.]